MLEDMLGDMLEDTLSLLTVLESNVPGMQGHTSRAISLIALGCTCVSAT